MIGERGASGVGVAVLVAAITGRAEAASLPGVVVVVGERDEVHGVGGGRRRRGRGARRPAARALLPQQLLVGGRAHLAELVHEREDALHR